MKTIKPSILYVVLTVGLCSLLLWAANTEPAVQNSESSTTTTDAESKTYIQSLRLFSPF